MSLSLRLGRFVVLCRCVQSSLTHATDDCADPVGGRLPSILSRLILFLSTWEPTGASEATAFVINSGRTGSRACPWRGGRCPWRRERVSSGATLNGDRGTTGFLRRSLTRALASLSSASGASDLRAVAINTNGRISNHAKHANSRHSRMMHERNGVEAKTSWKEKEATREEEKHTKTLQIHTKRDKTQSHRGRHEKRKHTQTPHSRCGSEPAQLTPIPEGVTGSCPPVTVLCPSPPLVARSVCVPSRSPAHCGVSLHHESLGLVNLRRATTSIRVDFQA